MKEKTGLAKVKEDDVKCDVLEKKVGLKSNIKVIDQKEAAEYDREIAIKQAEKYLDGQEYDLNRITAEINAQLGVAALAAVEVGRRLIAVKTVEGHGKFCTWVENNFPLSHQTANKWMRYSEVMQARPELNVLAKGGISKALVLLSLPEEYLQEIEEDQTIDGKPLDEMQTMTKKELEAEIKKLKSNQGKIIEEETKTLKSENDSLIRENKRLKAYEPAEETTPEWCLEKAQEIQLSSMRVVTLVRDLIADDRLKGDIQTKAKIQISMQIVQGAIDDLFRKVIDLDDEE